MPSRDPYPMSSKEAESLASSTEGGGQSLSNWNNMNTTSSERGPSSSAAEGSESKESLTNNSNSSDTDDIYANVDKPDEEDMEDVYLDRPLHELRAKSLPEKLYYKSSRVLYRLYIRLYGDKLPLSEMLRTLALGSTLFFMIGGYWLLRSLKDPILTALCGVAAIPRAKMLSVFVVLGVVSIYNKLLDSDLPRHVLFYIFGSFYFCLFTTISLLLMHPTVGLANERADEGRILGWISYCSIESFGSVMVSLFWSFCNSNFSLETAKASYGVMVALAQVGSILGPTIVNQYAATLGPAKIYLIGALCMLLLQGTMYGYVSVYGTQERNATETSPTAPDTKKKPKAGILEGLHLFWKHNYVKGIFAISTLFMVEVTIVDYTMKVLARNYFASLHPCLEGASCWRASTENGMSEDATAAFTTFMGLFGQATNTLSFLLSLLGTSAVIRYLGLRFTLLLFPTLCLAVIIFVRLHATLYVVFAAMMILKACSYSLNNPTKEMLYQPTSRAVRYKAKSWIDIFGARGAKAAGSVVTNAFAHSATQLVANGSLVGMAVASFLIWNARYMGKTFDQYMADGTIVGEDEDDDLKQHELTGVAGNEGEEEDDVDTSCAIQDDTAVGPEEEGQANEGSGDGGGGGGGGKAEVTMV